MGRKSSKVLLLLKIRNNRGNFYKISKLWRHCIAEHFMINFLLKIKGKNKNQNRLLYYMMLFGTVWSYSATYSQLSYLETRFPEIQG